MDFVPYLPDWTSGLPAILKLTVWLALPTLAWVEWPGSASVGRIYNRIAQNPLCGS
jgi:hypothetical protein